MALGGVRAPHGLGVASLVSNFGTPEWVSIDNSEERP